MTMLKLSAANFSNFVLLFYGVTLFIERLPLSSAFTVPNRRTTHRLYQQLQISPLSIAASSSSSADSVVLRDEHFMRLALRHAQHSFREKEVPVGAVIVDANGIILAASRNEVEAKNDVTAHAEISCIRKVAQMKNNWRLSDCTLYSTLEPCPMCMGAVQASRIKRVVFGAPDIRMGACGSWINLIDSKHPFHDVEVVGGLLEEESSTLLKRFFQMRRREAATIAATAKNASVLSATSDEIISSCTSEKYGGQEGDEKDATNRIVEKSSALHIDRGYGVEDLLAQQDPAF